MNRAQRRRLKRQAPGSVLAFAAAYRCLDCLSDNGQPWCDRFGVWHIDVRHDDTCPAYRRLLAGGRAR